MCFSASRLPFIPFFLAGLSFISLNPVIALVLKNVIFFAISALAFVQARNIFATPWPVILGSAIIFYLNPINAGIAAGLDFEEGYIYHLLPWAVIILAAQHRRLWQIFALSFVLFTLILIKSALIYFCVACAILLAVSERRHIFRALLPLLFLSLAIGGWGLFTLQATGKFAFGSDMSSLNGLNLYKGNNPQFSEYYPEINLDHLDYDGFTKLPGHFDNEWQINHKYMEMAIDYMKNNKYQTAANILERMYIVFLSPRDTGKSAKGEKQPPKLSPSIILMHIIVIISLMSAVFVIFRKENNNNNSNIRRVAIIYTIMIIAYIVPFLIGFAYSRHVVPACGMALFFIMAALGLIRSSDPKGSALLLTWAALTGERRHVRVLP